MIFPSGFVSLITVKVAVGPCHAVSGLLQLSLPDVDEEDETDVAGIVVAGTLVVRPVVVGRPVVDVSKFSRVGETIGVRVAGIVGVVVSVGGIGVSVGTDC